MQTGQCTVLNKQEKGLKWRGVPVCVKVVLCCSVRGFGLLSVPVAETAWRPGYPWAY